MRIINDLAHATAFLTRLPVPPAAFGNTTLDFGHCTWAFPIVGMLVGALGAIIGWSFFLLTGQPAIGAVIALGAMILLTGGLHEDGLADCADGFWGGRDTAARLRIMRDHAIGTYGTLALIIVVALRAAMLTALLVSGPLATLCGLIVAGAIGRFALLGHWLCLNPSGQSPDDAKGESLATRFGRPTRAQLVIAGAVVFTAGVSVLLLVPQLTVTVGVVVAVPAAGAVLLIARAKIGGFTGDTLGATALLTETAFLCGLLAPIGLP